ncbi:NACHT domain-containing NTPase [Acidisphaera sp. S103]|uniref:NACHT domain-containing protein n=1 Tax=Acidisphaera sp. S103 TaxID=1747223 RepID=UPI00131D4B9F|nr:NACHT domain-containing protein [Acidisphaera sp. S103]
MGKAGWESAESRPRQFVLVGGPGAGKSTYVKNRVLEALRDGGSKTMPFFLRLREYESKATIEELLARKLEALDIKDAKSLLIDKLRTPSCLCVLDGLDEVRPNLLEEACEAIDTFYMRYFKGQHSSLIVTCRKEAYRPILLSIPDIWEVLPLKDDQIQMFARHWPLRYPTNKSAGGFWADLNASPKVLEVSRSPLLLIGSLLLYTESNLGIPGERVRYLEKIKKTLVEDWATAQGHAPDVWRQSYGAVLVEIALQMQIQQNVELDRDICIDFLTEVLPRYGIEAHNAAAFVDNLARKTGILVQDVPGFVIFVQFALQEYFASLNLVNKFTPAEVARLEPPTWWRESTLLAVAQVSDPTAYVRALFEVSPMLGAVAVAEAPTPSLELQETAATLALQQLDLDDETSVLPLVSLLRKVSGGIERRICEELGNRLELGQSSIANLAGRVLATAGTGVATETLSHYPLSWKSVLDMTGYLSSTFEKLLLEWVSNPAHTHWYDAAELLSKRLDDDATPRLINILDKLPKDRAAFLANLVYERISEKLSYRNPLTWSNTVHLARCLTFINDVERLARTLQNSLTAERYVDDNQALPLVMLGIADKYGPHSTNLDGKVLGLVYDAISSSLSISSHTLLALSCLPILTSMIGLPVKYELGVLIIAVPILTNKTRFRLPWQRAYFFHQNVLLNFALFVVGALTVYPSPSALLSNSLSPDSPMNFALAASIVILSLLVNADARTSMWEMQSLPNWGFGTCPIVYYVICTTWLALLVVGLIISLYSPFSSYSRAAELATGGLLIYTTLQLMLMARGRSECSGYRGIKRSVASN